MLQQRASAASMKALRSTCQKCVCFITVWNKAVPTCRLQREERCSTFGLDWLLRSSVWMAHTTTSSKCRILVVNVCWQENIVRHGVDTVTSEQTNFDRRLWFYIIEAAEEQASLVAFQDSQLYDSAVWRRSAHSQSLFKWSVSKFRHFTYLSGLTTCSNGGRVRKNTPVPAVMHTLFRLMYLSQTLLVCIWFVFSHSAKWIPSRRRWW